MLRHHLRPLLHAATLLFAVVSFSCAVVGQSTWTVDSSAPADFAEISDAVLAAADGDTILVRSGNYDRFEVIGKGLCIEAEGSVTIASSIGVTPFVRIANTTASQTVTLRNVLIVAGTAGLQDIAFMVADCDGPVLLQDVRLSTFYSGHPLDVRNCASLTLSRCQLQSSTTFHGVLGGVLVGPAVYHAAAVRSSRLWIYDSSFEGGYGGGSFLFGGQVQPASVGGIALALHGSELFASNSTFVGGSTSNNPVSVCALGADGSAGILMAPWSGVPSTGRLIGCQATGGTAGLGSCGNGNGTPGLGIDAPAGAVTLLPGPAPTASIERVARPGETATLEIIGQAGDGVLLAWSIQFAVAIDLPAQPAGLHIGQPLNIVGLGVVSPAGTLSLPLAVPTLPSSVSLSFPLQAFTLSGAAFLDAGPQMLTILGPGL